MDLTQKFDRGAATKGGKKKRTKREEEEQWKGSEDVEKLSSIFTAYLTSPSNFARLDPDQASPKTVTNRDRDAAQEHF